MTVTTWANARAGEELPPLSRTVTRDDIRAYADASGDHNPLHQDDALARSVGFPGVIAHGMFTMAHLAGSVERWTGDPAAIERLSVQFREPVFPGDRIVAAGRVRSVDPTGGTVTLDLWVTVEHQGTGTTEHAIRRATAVVRR